MAARLAPCVIVAWSNEDGGTLPATSLGAAAHDATTPAANPSAKQGAIHWPMEGTKRMRTGVAGLDGEAAVRGQTRRDNRSSAPTGRAVRR